MLRLVQKAMVLLWGRPGMGKSTMACRSLDTLQGGAVALVATESGVGPAVRELLVRTAVKREDFYVVGRGASVDDVCRLLHDWKCVGACIDSAQQSAWTSGELRHILSVLPHLRVLFVTSQVNATGAPAGPTALLHECDVEIEVEDLRWRVNKSRYEAITSWRPVLPQPPQPPQAADTTPAPTRTPQPLSIVPDAAKEQPDGT